MTAAINWTEKPAGFWTVCTDGRWLTVWKRLNSAGWAWSSGGCGAGVQPTEAEAKAAAEGTVGLHRPAPVRLPPGMSASLAQGIARARRNAEAAAAGHGGVP